MRYGQRNRDIDEEELIRAEKLQKETVLYLINQNSAI